MAVSPYQVQLLVHRRSIAIFRIHLRQFTFLYTSSSLVCSLFPLKVLNTHDSGPQVPSILLLSSSYSAFSIVFEPDAPARGLQGNHSELFTSIHLTEIANKYATAYSDAVIPTATSKTVIPLETLA